MYEGEIIAYATTTTGGFLELQKSGIVSTDFAPPYSGIWDFIVQTTQQHGYPPSATMLESRYPSIELPDLNIKDLPHIIHSFFQQAKTKHLHQVLLKETQSLALHGSERVDQSLANIQSEINYLTAKNSSNHLAQLFTPDISARLLEEMRNKDKTKSIPTGLHTFDITTGGLQPQKMITIIGRTGMGKSWLDLLFVANAIIAGKKVILYPLEMTLAETAFRLYTIFSYYYFKNSKIKKVFKNSDLSMGTVNVPRLVKFMGVLERKYRDQLLIADVSELNDPYTIERIDAEVGLHKPDMFWVDYLTLLKMPSGKGEDWAAIRQLSNGIKSAAMRHNVVGGCSAQVNREAIRADVFLPRLEHIAFSDAIAHDSDQVFSVNKKDDYLYYSLVKNRGGKEIPATKVRFKVNRGLIEEVKGA
jgi:replicative DNA helicase